MLVLTALEIVKTLVYKPGWTFEAEDHSKRFEDSICIHICYPARDSARPYAREGYLVDILPCARASFPIMVGTITDTADLCRHIMTAIDAIDEHEAREFLRVAPSYWAPFHPHRVDGMARWGAPGTDLRFGLA